MMDPRTKKALEFMAARQALEASYLQAIGPQADLSGAMGPPQAAEPQLPAAVVAFADLGKK